MNIGQRIAERRKQLNMTQEELAYRMGYKSKSSINKIEMGVNDIPQKKIVQFAKELDTTINYLMGWEEEKRHQNLSQFFVEDQKQSRDIDTIYDALNEAGQQDLCRYGRYLTTLEEYRKPEEEPVIKMIQFFLTPAAAGYASPIDGSDYEMIPLPDGAPNGADFCIKIDGDSMEPYIKDGDMVYVKRGAPLQEFDVGIFFVGGDVYCKQYCPGYGGQLYLLSANPQRQDANVILMPEDARGCTCFGKVMLKKRLPKPLYM